MKKFFWVMFLTATVLFHSACGEGAASTNRTNAAYLESEGNTTNISKTALEMSQYAGEMKSGVSTGVYKTQVARKSPRFRGRNNLGTACSFAVIYLIDMAFDKKGKKESRR